MAKRRNLKKEKAQRNLAYARQFRKKTSRFQSKYKRYSGFNKDQEDNNDQNESDKKDDADNK
jgi:hypothetical protein